MKPAVLTNTLDEMISETKKGRLDWQLELQSTDGLADSLKHHVSEDGIDWAVDECFLSFFCKYHEKNWLLITYEYIKTHGNKVRTSNLLFMPPSSIRYFDVGILSPYIVQADAVLLDRIHQLYTLLMEAHKNKDGHVSLKVHDPYE